MKLITIQILKLGLRLKKWKLRYFKVINAFKYIIKWFVFAFSLLLKPKTLIRTIAASTRDFLRAVSLFKFSTINVKAVSVIAILMLLVSGSSWLLGERIGAQGTSTDREPVSGLDWYVGGGDLDSGMGPAIVRMLNTAFSGIGTGQPEGTIVGSNTNPSMKELGLIRSVGQMTTYTFRKPVSGNEYIASIKSKVNPNQKASAQGFFPGLGYQYLHPIFPLWATFRNIALSFIAVIIVIFGFIIMIGQKMGTASVTVANALPSVILAVILILFSYPIVGFMIDIADSASIFIYNTLCDTLRDPSNPNQQLRSCAKPDPLDPQGTYSYNDPVSGDRPVNIFTLVQGLNKTENVERAVSDIVDQILNTITGKGVGKTAGDIVSGIVKLIFFLAVISAMFKTFFGLLSAYIGIILKTILAPIQLLLVALPGGNTFVSWMKGILADVLVFPATFGALVITAVLMGNILSTAAIWGINFNISGSESLSWFPMPLGRFVDPNTGVDVVASLLGFGMLLFLPSIPGLIKSALKSTDVTGGATSQVAGQIKGIASQIPFVGGFVR